MSPPGEIQSFLEGSRSWIEGHLEAAVDALDPRPERLREALVYALTGGGKRLRPALVRLVAHSAGGNDALALAPALAVEMVHTYSLVHDDLPCMDDDDLRRGRATCHKVFGEDVAVLVGDGLLTGAFELLAVRGGARAGALVSALARAAGVNGMVGGQALDLAHSAGEIDRARVEEIHRRKTAALMAGSAELGAIAAGAQPAVQGAAQAYGEALGLCFQAVDDLLDVTGRAEELGKTPGKDAANDKPTLVALLGLEGARQEAQRLADAARSAAERAGWSPDSLPWQLVESVLQRAS